MVTVPIEERIAIQELTNLYALYCDTRCYDKVAALFMDECVYDESCLGLERVTTKAALLKLLYKASETLGPLVHFCPNHIISEFSSTSASGLCYVLAEGLYKVDGKESAFRIFGYYDDKYAKQDGQWYLKSRILRLLAPTIGGLTIGGITYDTGAPHFAMR